MKCIETFRKFFHLDCTTSEDGTRIVYNFSNLAEMAANLKEAHRIIQNNHLPLYAQGYSSDYIFHVLLVKPIVQPES